MFPLETMMCTVTIAVYIENRKQHISTLYGYNADFLRVKPDGTYVATRLRGVARVGRVAWSPWAASPRGDKINILN